MPPKSDPSEVKYITLRCFGGQDAGSRALAPKLAPLGLNVRKIIADISKATMGFKGLRVNIRLIVQNRIAQVEVLSTAATLLIKALPAPMRNHPHIHVVKHDGSISMDTVIDVARQVRSRSMAKEFKGTVREVLGTAVSIGCSIDGESPKNVIQQIDEGTVEVPLD